ncbi:hypothetical protein [Streptacidiphilus cavernicola]|uniref:PEGA domain-containing protein n=1 Tax=Streptacidiphilus cavernicola TaxID=3342716 RepID=A0ABV6VSC3_9ACTN
MAGAVFIRTEAPSLSKAGKLDVLVDGELVGTIKQGHAERFPVTPGPHTVRVGSGAGRSNVLTVEVPEDGTARLSAFSTGFALLVAVLPLLYVVCFIPGLVNRLRAEADLDLPDPATAADGAPGSGLWWESDPKLAKRFRNTDAS